MEENMEEGGEEGREWWLWWSKEIVKIVWRMEIEKEGR